MQDWEVWIYRPRGVDAQDGKGEGEGDDSRCAGGIADVEVA